MPQTLQRTTFQTSRLLEFFSEPALQIQIGLPREQWPIARLKELINNPLKAAETAGVLPDIVVPVALDTLSVRNPGPGLAVKIGRQSLNDRVRVSDQANDVSPSRVRGIQGGGGPSFFCHERADDVDLELTTDDRDLAIAC
jgi:DNA topoisomerase VI subunit B